MFIDILIFFAWYDKIIVSCNICGVRAIKTFNIVKKIALASIMVLGAALVLFGQIPELPSSKPILPGNFGTEIRAYISENLFPIVFFIASLVVGIFIEIYGLSIRYNISSLKTESRAGVMLGIFIFVSGIWILTDSKVLSVFTTDYGGTLDKNAIVFISYISIMLLPIIFIAFLRHIIQIEKILWIIDGLFLLNLFTFVILTTFYLSKEFYFLFLIIHHTLIYVLMIIGTVYCIKNLRGTKDKQKKWLSHGVLFFMFFSGAALIVFLFGFSHLYVIIYGMGFAIMIQYMIKLTVYKMLAAYNQSIKTELYKSIAYTDMLTDIKNRNAFINEQYGSTVNKTTCCIVMDINKLKWVNDTLGHNYGDQLIRRSAKVIYDSFSDIGVCYRIGGDEFAVICQNSDEYDVKNTIKKMKNLISAANSDSEPQISLSCGYAFGGNGITNFTDLFNAADKEMYADKKSRNYNYV